MRGTCVRIAGTLTTPPEGAKPEQKLRQKPRKRAKSACSSTSGASGNAYRSVLELGLSGTLLDQGHSMLVMLAPSCDGSTDAYGRLARATGMLAYDLKSRLKPGVWGVVRALADEEQAHALVQRLREEGFPVVVMAREVAHDPNRRIVTVRALEL